MDATGRAALARAVVASGAVAKALGRRLVELDDAALRPLAAVAGNDLIVVLGEAAALPWADGVVYLGRDESAPDLLLLRPHWLQPLRPRCSKQRFARSFREHHRSPCCLRPLG